MHYSERETIDKAVFASSQVVISSVFSIQHRSKAVRPAFRAQESVFHFKLTSYGLLCVFMFLLLSL